MNIRDDVRDYFEREARRMPPPAGLRADVTSRAVAAQLPAVRPIRWAAVVATVLAIAIIAGLIAAGELRRLLGPSPANVVQPGRHGFIVDGDLVDRNHGWVLLVDTNPSSSTARFWVETTYDGAKTWVDPLQVGGRYAIDSSDTPRHIHFANANDGFVYGLGMAFATHDGGRTWAQLQSNTGEIRSITGYSVIWAVIGTQVRTSIDGGRTWQPAAPLPANFAPAAQAVPFGTDGLLLPSLGIGDMARTDDGGRTWTRIAGQCSPQILSNTIATPDGTEMWQYCSGTPTSQYPTANTMSVSVDGGRTWVRRPPYPDQTLAPTLISLQPDTALLLTSSNGFIDGEMLISRDLGVSWHKVISIPAQEGVVFCQNGDGWAFDGDGHVWASSDHGQSWGRLPAAP